MVLKLFILGDVSCFGHDCYVLAFGVPAVLMILSLGKYKFDAICLHFAILTCLPCSLKKEKKVRKNYDDIKVCTCDCINLGRCKLLKLKIKHKNNYHS